MTKVILVGGFHEIVELAEDNSVEIVGIIDKKGIGYFRQYQIISNDENASELKSFYRNIPLIITPDKPDIRKKLFEYYSNLGFFFSSLVSNKSTISKTATVEEGVVIQSGVNLSAETAIGKFVKLNSLCNIMHNSRVGEFSTIAPNAVILGNVNIGKLCYIGSNSTILPNIYICDNVVIGAGAVVTREITLPGVYVGVPAKLLKPID